MIRRIFLYIVVLLLGCVLGANVYNSAVDAPNWGSSIPASLDVAKHYFTVANPGTFFRVASPAAQVAAVLALIAAWPAGKTVRLLTVLALILSILGDVFTFAYFYPRNEIMFGGEAYPVEVLQTAWTGWSGMNNVRSGLILAAVLCELAALSGFERRSAIKSAVFPPAASSA